MPALAFSQSTDVKPSFEIADVHVSPPTRFSRMRNPVIRQGRYAIRQATMVDLIRTAYSIDAARVQGARSWLEDDRFDVIATAPRRSTRPKRRSPCSKPYL